MAPPTSRRRAATPTTIALKQLLADEHRRPVGWVGAGSDGVEAPPIYIDRVGAKVGLEDTYSRNSKGSLNLVLQQVQPRHPRAPAHTPGDRFAVWQPSATHGCARAVSPATAPCSCSEVRGRISLPPDSSLWVAVHAAPSSGLSLSSSRILVCENAHAP